MGDRMSEIEKKAASKSLEITIREIMEFLEQEERGPTKRRRALLHKKLGDFGRYWFARGFNRGHKETKAHFVKHKKIPKTLKYEGHRTLFLDGQRKVKLKSKL
jgi:hypothetical protein